MDLRASFRVSQNSFWNEKKKNIAFWQVFFKCPTVLFSRVKTHVYM